MVSSSPPRNLPKRCARDGAVSECSEDAYELRMASTVRRALSEILPEAVAAAAYEFITGPC